MPRKVLDFVQKRKESVEKKRRSFERIMFQNLMGVYTALDQDGLIYPIGLVDISKDGCLFEVAADQSKEKKLAKGTEFTLRLYFTNKSYIPAIVKIRYCQEYIAEDGQLYLRYGAEFDKSTSSYLALGSFIEFLYNFAENSVIDHGDVKAFFL